MKYILYNNGSSENRGCEAIAIGTLNILKNDFAYLCTLDKSQDHQLQCLKNLKLVEYRLNRKPHLVNRVIGKFERMIFKTNKYYNTLNLKNIINILPDIDIALSAGGDNYCYNYNEWLYETHNIMKKNNKKTVLWGCSIEPSHIDEKMKNDFKKYDLIIARESISYKVLKKINKNTYLYPDPAFTLSEQEIKLPKIFKSDVVGINLSSLFMAQYENNNKIILNNYKTLIKYILENTNYNIALIPHVIYKNNTGDYEALKMLMKLFQDNPRIYLFGKQNCLEYRYIISKCRFLITARTHASIAGYSTCVPTLVVGYSTKAKGIAKDIFGDYEKYILPVQNLKKNSDILTAFKYFLNNEKEIIKTLKRVIPNYNLKAYEAGKKIKEIMCER